MRPSTMFRSKIVFLMALSLMVGCAAQMTQLQRAERQYQQAEAEKEREAAQAAAAQAQADEAARAETEAGKGLSTALVQDAEERVKYVEQQLKTAEAQRQRACVLNPQLDFCKKDEPPPVQAAAEPPPQQPAAAAPPQATAPEPPSVDFKMNEFSATGMQRLTPLPVGWEVGFDAAKGHIVLAIDGARKYERSKPAQFKPGICYRFLADTVEACPAAPAPPPAP